MPRPNLSIAHIVDPARNYEAVAGALQQRKADDKASEPAIRADERRVCAEIVRGWLPRRQAFDSSFEEAMAALADKMESRQ
jgi:hypothetical protein